eukprot:jgi/Orpsp1_1/1190544/evm.model.d7180000079661.1
MDSTKRTDLEYNIINCNVQRVEDILNDDNIKSIDSYLLLLALKAENYAIINKILKKTIYFDNENENGSSNIFLESVKSNDNIIVEKIANYFYTNKIEYDINVRDKDGRNPFLIATMNQNIEIMTTLIEIANKKEVTLNINEKDNDGRYSLLVATLLKNYNMVKVIVNYVKEKHILIDLNDKSNKYNNTSPIIYAINSNNTEIFNEIYACDQRIKIELDETDIKDFENINNAIFQEIVNMNGHLSIKFKNNSEKYKQYNKRKEILTNSYINEKIKLAIQNSSIEKGKFVRITNDCYISEDSNSYILKIKKEDDYLIETKRDKENKWAWGYNLCNPNKIGKFPTAFVEENIDED